MPPLIVSRLSVEVDLLNRKPGRPPWPHGLSALFHFVPGQEKKKTKPCLRLERQMKTPAHIWIINTGSSDPDPTIFYFKYNIGTGTSHEGLCIVKLFLKLVPVPTPVLKFLEKNKNIWCG